MTELQNLFDSIDYSKIGGKYNDPNYSIWGRQLWISKVDEETLAANPLGIGTGMHGDMCASITIQVSASKHWVNYHDEIAHIWKPTVKWGLPIGMGHRDSRHWLDGIPRKVNDMSAGDVLYTPEWYWHWVM